MKKALPYVLVGYIIFVFVQSRFFKFAGSEETMIIFTTIAEWMQGIPVLNLIAGPFGAVGGYVIGTVELIAAGLLLFAGTRVYGALISLGVISGAIFFHLFTPLGVNRVVDAAGNTDGGALFFMAVGVWVASATLTYLNRRRLPFRFSRSDVAVDLPAGAHGVQ